MLRIISSNKNFSYIINKHPVTNSFERSVRKGKVYGSFSGDNTYSLWFEDHTNETSFGRDKNDFNFLDVTRFAHPAMLQAIMWEAFRTLVNKPDERDFDANHEAIFLLKADNYSVVEKLCKAFSLALVRHEEASSKAVHSLSIAAIGMPLRRLVSILSLIFFIVALKDSEHDAGFNEDLVQKYSKMISELDAPYLARHIFKTSALWSHDVYKRHGESVNTPIIKMTYGNSQQQRQVFIKKHIKLPSEFPLVDIGAGELFHAKAFAGHFPIVRAYEKNEQLIDRALHKAKLKGIENIEPMGEYTGQDLNGCQVLMIEMIEHLQLEEAVIMLQNVASSGFTQLILTCPNFNFNRYFMIEGFRHPDHKWEPTSAQLAGIMSSVFTSDNFKVSYYQVGDIVAGQSMALGFVVEAI
jgi:small RNA 2'-O-methyltransferase